MTVRSCHRTDTDSLPHDVHGVLPFRRSASAAGSQRLYRLVDRQCAPHPVLDDHFESMDAAWEAALSWWEEQACAVEQPIEIGIEVSTPAVTGAPCATRVAGRA